MNVIDQAFAKAYSRRTSPKSAESASSRAAASDTSAGSPDVSVHPHAAHSAVVWVDAVADQYLRRDTRHHTAIAPQVKPQSVPAPSGNRARVISGQAVEPNANRAASSVGSNITPFGTTAQSATPPSDSAQLPAGQSTGKSTASRADAQSFDLSSLYHCVIASGTPADTLAIPLTPLALPAIQTVARVPNATAAVAAQPSAPARQPEPARQQEPARQLNPLHQTEPARQIEASFKPFAAQWEVDAFEFSSTITALFGDPTLMESIGSPLDRAVSEGLQTLMVTSDRPRAGQTSVATGIALSAAAAGLRVALVDAAAATIGSPGSSLADTLNLDVQQGWVEAIRGGISVAETAIHSIEDQLTVIPQATVRASTSETTPTATEFSRMIQMLRKGFDLVVIDGPSCHQPTFAAFLTRPRSDGDRSSVRPQTSDSMPIDAVILVRDVRHADVAGAAGMMETLKRYGITGLGLVENFT